MGAPLYVTSYFSLTAFKILSLSWNFSTLIMMCLTVDLFGFLLLGLSVFPGCVTFSLIKLRKFSIITFSIRFSIPYSSSSPSGIPIIRILLHFMFSCISLNPSSFFLSPFSFSSSFCVFFSTLSSSLLIQVSAHQVCFSFLLLFSSVQKLYSAFPLGPC